MINVSGQLQDQSGTAITSNAWVRFNMRYLGGNQPYVSGTALVSPAGSQDGPTWYKDFAVDGSGNIAGSLYSTSEVTVGGLTGVIAYGMVVYRNGQPGPESIVSAGGNININNPNILNNQPVSVAPTGDATYLRLDGSNSPVVGSVSFTGTDAFKYLNNIRFASQFSGADLGAKINLADADLGSAVGEIWVDRLSGTTISTAVSLSAKHTLRFIQGGQYDVSAAITLGQGAGITGVLAGMFETNNTANLPPVLLKMANSANLATMITLSGAQAFVQGVMLHGNNTNQASGTALINITASRCQLDCVSVYASKADGIQINSTGTNLEAHSAMLNRVMSIGNTGKGLYSVRTSDVFISDSEFEQNGGLGVEFFASNSPRIIHSDISGNNAGGMKVTGLSTSALLGGSFGTILSCYFGSNVGGDDLNINGWDASNSAAATQEWLVEGNVFAGTGATTNTVDAIHLVDTIATVTGNLVHSNASPTYKYGLETAFVNRGAIFNQVGVNYLNGTFGTSAYLLAAGDSAVGLVNGADGYARLQKAVLLNNSPLYVFDAAGTARQLLLADGSNNIIMRGNPTTQAIFFQSNASGTDLLLQPSGAQVKRLKAALGTALVAGDFALSAGWGNTAAVSAVTGTDQGWNITVTCNGTGILANPTITLTFKDGTWTSSPIGISKMVGGTGTLTSLTDAPTATTWVITFNGTPVAASTYFISGIAMGR